MQREDLAIAAAGARQWDLSPDTTLTRLLALNARSHGR
jgi:hypothetical protein